MGLEETGRGLYALWLDTLTANGSGSGGGTRGGQRYNPSTHTWYQVRIDGGPPSRESPGKHVLILLSQLESYKGAKQQRCWECNELVSWCCARPTGSRSR